MFEKAVRCTGIHGKFKNWCDKRSCKWSTNVETEGATTGQQATFEETIDC